MVSLKCIYHNRTTGSEDALLRPATSWGQGHVRTIATCAPQVDVIEPNCLPSYPVVATPHHCRGYQRMTGVVHGFQKKESLVSQDARMKRIAWLGVSINFSRRRGKFQRRIFSKKSFAVNWKAFFVRIGWRFTQNLWPFGIFRAPESPGRKKNMRMLNLVGGWSGWCLLLYKCWFCLFWPWGKKYFGALFVVHLFVFAYILRYTLAGSDDTGAVSAQHNWEVSNTESHVILATKPPDPWLSFGLGWMAEFRTSWYVGRSWSHYVYTVFYTSQMVQDFFHRPVVFSLLLSLTSYLLVQKNWAEK